jgi:hypothetical protein
MSAAATAARIDLDLIALGRDAVAALDALYATAKASVRARVEKDGKVSAALVDKEQRATHGLAWLATYVESLREMVDYSERLTAEGRFGEIERDIVSIAFGEYLAQVFGGIPMNQGELVRLSDLGVPAEAAAAARVTVALRRGLTALLVDVLVLVLALVAAGLLALVTFAGLDVLAACASCAGATDTRRNGVTMAAAARRATHPYRLMVCPDRLYLRASKKAILVMNPSFRRYS